MQTVAKPATLWLQYELNETNLAQTQIKNIVRETKYELILSNLIIIPDENHISPPIVSNFTNVLCLNDVYQINSFFLIFMETSWLN